MTDAEIDKTIDILGAKVLFDSKNDKLIGLNNLRLSPGNGFKFRADIWATDDKKLPRLKTVGRRGKHE